MGSGGPSSGSRRLRNHGTGRSLAARLLARLAVGLLDRLGGEVGSLGGELGSALVADLLALQFAREPAQALADFPQPPVHAASLSRRTAPRMPLTKRGASAPQYSLASSIASSIA